MPSGSKGYSEVGNNCQMEAKVTRRWEIIAKLKQKLLGGGKHCSTGKSHSRAESKAGTFRVSSYSSCRSVLENLLYAVQQDEILQMDIFRTNESWEFSEISCLWKNIFNASVVESKLIVKDNSVVKS